MNSDVRMNGAAAIQSLLYYNPLYNWIPDNEKNLNVMAVGYDCYTEKFIDLCLQAGQMRGRRLCITVVTDSPSQAKAGYLMSRPAIPDFVQVDGSLAGNREETYAVLNFASIPGVQHRFFKEPFEANLPVIEELMLDSLEEEHVHYIFLSLGDDGYNRRMAKLFSDTAEMLENRCSVNYVTESESEPAGSEDSLLLHPVCIRRPLPLKSEKLEDMAFHCHILWQGNENIDVQRAWEEFRQSYYYESSMAYVLSIPYKLHSIGITDSDRNKAAADFYEKILRRRETDPDSEQMFQQLVALEHRRWVLEKITDGWQAPSDYSYCIKNGSVKDMERKLHPCIVRSTEETPLKSKKYTADSCKRWEYANAEDDKLDDLDRVSLALHRLFKGYTMNYRRSHPLKKREMAQIKELISKAPEGILMEYRRFRLCLNEILDGDTGYSGQYQSCEKRFADTVRTAAGINEETKQAVQQCLERIRHDFFPVIEYNLYRDYKELDEVMIRNIPFILTWRKLPHLAIALDLARDRGGSSDVVFRNVASATVIQPGRITYMYCFDRYSDIMLLERKLLSIANYYRHRKMNCRLHIRIAFLQNVRRPQSELCRKKTELRAMLGRLGKNQELKNLEAEIMDCQEEEAAAAWFLSVLKDSKADLFDGSNALFASHRQNSAFIQQVTERHPYFEFDSASKCFLHDSRCRYLHYIEDHSYMRVEDMFALMNAEDREFHYQDFASEYIDLWNIYTGKGCGLSFENAVRCWNNLCMQLDRYCVRTKDTEHVSLELGDFCKSNYFIRQYEKLLNSLHQKGFILDLEYQKTKVTFRYSSRKMQCLLTKAGEILEVYTYYEACKTGYFDEVISSYEYKWEAGGVTNELDCVLIKGFRSMIVECKARPELSQEFYHKLDSLAGRFGISTRKVLIANTYVNKDCFEEINSMQRTRGELMDIRTIFGEKDICNIGETLKNIMEEDR